MLVGSSRSLHARARVEAAPLGFKGLDPRRQLVVEPVVDLKAAAEVRDNTALRRLAWAECFLDASPRLAQPDATDRLVEDDQPVLRLRRARHGHAGADVSRGIARRRAADGCSAREEQHRNSSEEDAAGRHHSVGGTARSFRLLSPDSSSRCPRRRPRARRVTCLRGCLSSSRSRSWPAVRPPRRPALRRA